MKNFFQKLFSWSSSNKYRILFAVTIVISICAQIYFYLQGNQNLADYDAIARLNIARKILDSVTPGIGQLGGIWLPFPQILFLPFIWNDFLWHTGLAASFVSGTAFVLAAIFLEKTAYNLTKNTLASLFVWFIFVSNVNLLLLQTMAMSEIFFLFSFIMILYYLSKWIKTKEFVDFLFIGVFTSFITLTRYEGYFVFIGVFLALATVCIMDYWKKEGREKVEGMLLIFLTVGAFGILLWCLYCLLFYKDPLFWLHLYSQHKGQITSLLVDKPAEQVASQGSHYSFAEAFTIYGSVILWTNGIITTCLGIFGVVTMFYELLRKKISKNKKRLYISFLIMSMTLLFFLVYGYVRGFIPTIEFPPITLEHILSKAFNNYSHSNIRYGIILAPFIFLFAGFAASRNKILGVIIPILFLFQFITIFYTQFFLYFSFPVSWGYSISPHTQWLASHYDRGLILISANRHENFIFQSRLPYKNFIYEGTRDYWLSSLDNPQKHASWVIYNKKIPGDAVADYLTEHAHWVLDTHYYLVYQKDGFYIYHLKKEYQNLLLQD